MKECNVCGTLVDEQARFCSACGSTELIEAGTTGQQMEEIQTYPLNFDSAYQVQNVKSNGEEDGNGNILAGFVGAFLFSLIGGLLYFVLYQVGIIAGICGLVIFVLANFGHGLFAKTKNKASIAALIASIAATIVMIFLAEYISLSFEIFQAYKDYGITFFDAIRATPEFLEEPEIASALAEELTIAYMLGFIASISNIVNIVKSRKRKNKQIR